jgi:hypothetical protein
MERRSRRISLPTGVLILIGVITAVASVYYTVKELEWRNADVRPRVVTSSPGYSLSPPPKPIPLSFTFRNDGIEDARNVKIQIAITDLLRTHTKILKLDAYEIPRLARGGTQMVRTVIENFQDFVVVCIEYSNDGGAQFRDPPTVYPTTPLFYEPGDQEPRWRSVGVQPSALETEKLAEGFSCAGLEPRATKQPPR